MISPDDLIGLKELADEYDRDAVAMAGYADNPVRGRQAIQLFQLAAMLRDYVERNG